MNEVQEDRSSDNGKLSSRILCEHTRDANFKNTKENKNKSKKKTMTTTAKKKSESYEECDSMSCVEESVFFFIAHLCIGI